MIPNINNSSIIPYQNSEIAQQKRKRDCLEINEKAIDQKIFEDCEKLDKNLETQVENAKNVYKKLKKLAKKKKLAEQFDPQPTLIGSSLLNKNLKKHIYSFLDTNSLNALRLTNKVQKKLVDDLRISWIDRGKIPQDLGFISTELFTNYIENYKDKDRILKQVLINRLNKGESLEACGFPQNYAKFASTLRRVEANEIKTIASLKDHYWDKDVRMSVKNNKQVFNAQIMASAFPNIERIDLIVDPQINPFPKNVINQIRINFPKLGHLVVDSSSLNDESAKELKNIKNLKILKIIRDCVSSFDFLDDLTAIEELTIENCNQDLNEDLKLSNLKVLQLKNLPQLSHLLFLKNCRNLQVLRIENCPQINDSNISETLLNLIENCHQDLNEDLKLPNLKVLQLKNLPQLSDLLFLKNCPNLQVLRIENCPQINDFNILETLLNLNELYLSKVVRENFDFLENLKKIEKLALVNCGFESDGDYEFDWVIKIKFLNKLQFLKVLEISHKGLTDIDYTDVSPCEGLQVLKAKDAIFKAKKDDAKYDFKIDMGEIFPNLHTLDVTNSINVYTLGIENLTKLKKLVLDKTDIEELKFLNRLKLKSLSLERCECLDKTNNIPKHLKYFTDTDGHTFILN